ncbi:N-acetyl-gamma-glutamyl-phosphate reductase [Candidatus Kinetoplastidibacterium galati]|uniref:N-acetyl-gamma-glutamyl-phosphate reductase n=1 Tax=Candidatus Kinetoplastidibacterium galati TCC219 TaxID=1208921 RepID=M1MBX1_9PROT|nr:N-acetyl-gamma-glutamyl-phosphate reductase [Candidatus Kinetoplastibacterium galatii]AGF49305.1 N-acetyl-gamma-glutamyl-phosphate reductase [Candidatus Kinetoplastibacterium galatii TCC219]
MHNYFNKKIKVGIVGGTGYTGVELLRILIQHPNVDLTVITSRKESGLYVSDLYPNLRNHISLKFSSLDNPDLMNCDVVFFATPHGVAMSQARDLLKSGVKIIDLAADFRIKDIDVFEKWYKIEHSCPDILKTSEYGLVELNRSNIVKSNVIGNPGCYPTTVILGLIPLLDQSIPLIDVDDIVADCKSGVSGSGKKLEASGLFSESSDNFKAYSVSGHRHHPEIVSQIEKISGKKVNLTFVPHLVPMIRGMFSTIYVKILPHALDIDFQELFVKRYGSEPFIDIMPYGSLPETRSVRSSNNLRIAIYRPGNKDRLIILVTQDNLVKGAAGQAVQNMNLIFNIKETIGLESIAILP